MEKESPNSVQKLVDRGYSPVSAGHILGISAVKIQAWVAAGLIRVRSPKADVLFGRVSA